MPLAQPAVSADVLELIRKTVYGPNAPTSSLDFNGLFGPLSNSLGNGNPQSLQALIANINGESPGGGPANNASAEATAESSAVGNTIGAVAANAVTGMIGLPGLAAAINAATHNAISITAAIAGNNGVNPDGTTDTSPTATGTSAVADAANADSDSGADSGAGGTADSGDGGGAGGVGGGGSGDSSGDGGGAGGVGGGGDSGYFTGGFVPGPPTGQDHVPVNLDGGEVVIPSDIVQMLGRNFFEDILVNTKSPIEVAAEKAAKAAKGAK